ncbi:MAG TPA: DUF1592 domain-containing protein [Polyangiaceae bacterium]|nr:DUF1592 domain-containing protein [Polyangiaceae bacterium]
MQAFHISRLAPIALLALAAFGCSGKSSTDANANGNAAGGSGPGGNGVSGSGGTTGVMQTGPAGGGGPGAGGTAVTGNVGGGPGTDPADPRLQARVWRLTPTQYNGEVQRFFPGAPTVDLPVGGSEYGLTNIASAARIDTGNATQYTEAARSIGTWVATQGAAAARCTTFGTTECVDAFLDWFLPAAYRRPPTTAERTEIRGVYDDTVATYGPDWAFSAMVRTVLLAPQFLYRTEIGPDGTGIVPIDDYEIASLMSFSLLDQGPDQALLTDAEAGMLHDPTVREQHARRLMDGTASIWQRFFWEWLKMSTLQSQGVETGLNPTLIAGLQDEYNAFVQNVVVTNRGSLSTLLTSNHTWGSTEVATYYGATQPAAGVAAFDLDPAQRGGLLTLGAWLVSHGKKGRDNVVRRGMGVYRDAMCLDIKPLNIDLQAAQMMLVGADATIKQIADARGSSPTCGACHATSDPVGLAFESYAGDGTWQTTYPDGKPVEAQVTWNGMQYNTPAEVSAAIAQDPRFGQCLVQRFGHFLLGADYGSPVTVRASGAAYDAFKTSNGSFEELLVAIVRDPTFIERRKE